MSKDNLLQHYFFQTKNMLCSSRMNTSFLNKKMVIIVGIAVSFLATTMPVNAASLHYGAWLPFWKKQSGAHDMSRYIDSFYSISPFSYEVKANGTLIDSLKITEGFWPTWLSAVRDSGVKIIPTLASFDNEVINALITKKTARKNHIASIIALIKKQKFSGIDIDYENKDAESAPYFSAFIKELATELHKNKKILSCTIEPRTPASSRFSVIPKDLSYANDYAILNKYCDEVRIMAYDQGTIDLLLNAKKGASDFYAPVADPEWVEKVLQETLKTINRKKIVLGIPTYGYEYEVGWNDGVTTYKRLRSLTFTQALERAAGAGATTTRNSAGELSYIYTTSTSVEISKNLTYQIVSSTKPTTMNTLGFIRFASFNDAESIAQKIALAKKYKLGGVVLFKMDGEFDPSLWNVIAKK